MALYYPDENNACGSLIRQNKDFFFHAKNSQYKVHENICP